MAVYVEAGDVIVGTPGETHQAGAAARVVFGSKTILGRNMRHWRDKKHRRHAIVQAISNRGKQGQLRAY